MSDIQNIWQNHVLPPEAIERVEFRTYRPAGKNYGNSDAIEISVNQQDGFIQFSEAALYIEGKITKTAGAGVLGLVNNAGAFMFESISYELDGKEIDRVREPGIVSTVRGYLCYEEQQSKWRGIGGWNYPSDSWLNHDNHFYMRIPISHLLGLFVDHKPIMVGRHTLRLIRSRTDNNALFATDAATKGTLEINLIELKVKHVFLTDVYKLNTMEQIRADKPIVIEWRQFEFHENPVIPENSNQYVWTVMTGSKSPDYVILAHHSEDRKDNLHKNPTLFDHVNLSDAKLWINSNYYPHESMKIDFDKNRFMEPFYAYSEFAGSFFKDCPDIPRFRAPLLNYAAFKERALFIFDCSKHSESMKPSIVDIKLEAETKTGFPPNTRAYCIVIHRRVVEQLPLSELVRQLI